MEEINVQCAQAFREIFVQYAQLHERLGGMDQRLVAVAKAVMGDGRPRDSLLGRMERLESAAETTGRCGDRLWKILSVAAALAAVLVAILK